MKTKVSAQKIINTCEKHGVINWAVLKELVWLDVERAVKKKEYRKWQTN